ncbi:MAG: chromate transporter [Bacteroidales bacterium]|nr:chromate transporter [Bacteroidales bacterium]
MTLFLQLFWTFLKIGLFTFGGGYAMVALIQDEVCTRFGWLTPQEFTDILAVSQATPGPIGINAATYTGYTAVVNAGYAPWLGVVGSLLASGAVILLPVVLMVLAVRFLRKMQGNKDVDNVFRVLRMAVVGLIAAAALQLVGVESFGEPGLSLKFLLSVAIFIGVFVLSMKKVSPLWLILASGVVGLVVYSVW